MDFSATEEQKILKKVTRDFLERECPKQMVRVLTEDEKGYSPQIWRKIAELGWLGLAFPSEYGGENGSFMDLVMLMQEMGRALLPSPYLASIVLAGFCILQAGSEEQKREILPRLLKGETILTMAVSESDSVYDASSMEVSAVSSGNGYVINGVILFVPYGNVADYLICVARTKETTEENEGITSFLVDTRREGISISRLKTLGLDNQCQVTFNETPVLKKDIIGEMKRGRAAIADALERGTVALCAYMNGGAEQVLEMTLAYAKQREQFGRPLSDLQAIQHHYADMAIALEVSCNLTYEAAWKVSQGVSSTSLISAAKARANESYRQIARLGMMIHGGVGYMKDHDMSLYYRDAKSAELTFGSTMTHYQNIARELLD